MTDPAGPSPGNVYGNEHDAFLVVEHDECGCIFIRAISLVTTPDYPYCSFLPFRDDQVGEFFFNSGYWKLSNTPISVFKLAARKATKPKKPKKKPKKSK